MSMTDPIADLLTRLRNGQMARHTTVQIPASRIKAEIVKILQEEGYIESFGVEGDGPKQQIKVELKYLRGGKGAIEGIERVSSPGRRVYCGKDEIPKVLNGLGINILSTSKGLMTGGACRKEGVGGEILCNIW